MITVSENASQRVESLMAEEGLGTGPGAPKWRKQIRTYVGFMSIGVGYACLFAGVGYPILGLGFGAGIAGGPP